jgi:hypothetical protein
MPHLLPSIIHGREHAQALVDALDNMLSMITHG